MKWTNPVGQTTPARLYIGDTLVVTIKERPTGDFPFYFSQKIIISYSGGFGSIQAAKKHVEKRLRRFAIIVSKKSKIKNTMSKNTEEEIFRFV